MNVLTFTGLFRCAILRQQRGEKSYEIYDCDFDLDGTILNTLEDLADSTNYALKTCGYPERTMDEVRQFVGNGIRKLMERQCRKELRWKKLTGYTRHLRHIIRFIVQIKPDLMTGSWSFSRI